MSFVAGMLVSVQDYVSILAQHQELDLFGIFIVVTPHIVNQSISAEIFNVNQNRRLIKLPVSINKGKSKGTFNTKSPLKTSLYFKTQKKHIVHLNNGISISHLEHII